MAKNYQVCCDQFRQLKDNHKARRRDRPGGEVSGRKLNVLLGKDPDDINFMDPNNQHYVCRYMVDYCAKNIVPNDPRLRKAKPPQKVSASRRSRRVELLNPERETLDAGSIKK